VYINLLIFRRALVQQLLTGFTFLVLAHMGNPGQRPEGCKMDGRVCVPGDR